MVDWAKHRGDIPGSVSFVVGSKINNQQSKINNS
jgi:hypothetical protein